MNNVLKVSLRSGSRPGVRRLIGPALIGVLLFSLFSGLGVWQLYRRAWKLNLIAEVAARVHSAPVPAPGPAEWSRLDAARDAYRRVRLQGRYVAGRDTLVQAMTAAGAGCWVLTPFSSDQSFTVLVNRGFIPQDMADAVRRGLQAAAGPTEVVGLLRMSRPGGGFLRPNDPSHDVWTSPDVMAIAKTRGLSAAPYYVDAEHRPGPVRYPLDGLTVVSFPNNHLVYALTWFTLAGLSLAGTLLVSRGVPSSDAVLRLKGRRGCQET